MASKRLNHYDTLGVNRNATPKEVKLAYKMMALALHPDKNKFGAQLMKQINEAKDVLLDESKRNKYDSYLDSGGSSINEQESSSSGTNSLQQRLIQSEHQRIMLSMKVSTLEMELAVAKCAYTPPRNELQNQLRHSEQRQRMLELQIGSLQLDNQRLSWDLGEAERENQQISWVNKCYEKEVSNGSRNLEKALREERRRSDGKLRSTLKAERDKANVEVENVRKSLHDHSLCFLCNGESGANCSSCRGYGVLHGQWTKCHTCDGKGWFKSIGGKKQTAMPVSRRGLVQEHSLYLASSAKVRAPTQMTAMFVT